MLDAIGSVFGLIAIGLYFLAGDQSTLLWITVGVLILHVYIIAVKSNYASDAMLRRGSNPDEKISRYTIAEELEVPKAVRFLSNILSIILAILLTGCFVSLWKTGPLTWIFGGIVWLLVELAFRARTKRIRMHEKGKSVHSNRN